MTMKRQYILSCQTLGLFYGRYDTIWGPILNIKSRIWTEATPKPALKAQCHSSTEISCWSCVCCGVSCHVSMNCWYDTLPHILLLVDSFSSYWVSLHTSLHGQSKVDVVFINKILFVAVLILNNYESNPPPSVLQETRANEARMIEWQLLVSGFAAKYCCIERRWCCTCMPISCHTYPLHLRVALTLPQLPLPLFLFQYIPCRDGHTCLSQHPFVHCQT